MSAFETDYKNALIKILSDNLIRDDRTGFGTISNFSIQLEHVLADMFLPIITGKKIFDKNFITEFQWLIEGHETIDIFKKNNVSIWDKWADSNGFLGTGTYGSTMINFDNKKINQLENVIQAIIKNPNSRRHILTLWNPKVVDKQALPPCYHNFQFFHYNGKLHLHVLQRSGDMFIGVPYDIIIFTLLLKYVSIRTGYIAGKIKLTIVDAHIYLNHIEQVKEYLKQPIHIFPMYEMKIENMFDKDWLTINGFRNENHIKAEVNK